MIHSAYKSLIEKLLPMHMTARLFSLIYVYLNLTVFVPVDATVVDLIAAEEMSQVLKTATPDQARTVRKRVHCNYLLLYSERRLWHHNQRLDSYTRIVQN